MPLTCRTASATGSCNGKSLRRLHRLPINRPAADALLAYLADRDDVARPCGPPSRPSGLGTEPALLLNRLEVEDLQGYRGR